MKTLLKLSSTLVLCSALACSSTSKLKEEAAVAPQFQLKPIQEKTLANGLRVLYISDPSLPRVSLQLLVASGAAHEAPGSEGLAAMTLSLLEQGTTRKSALQIADDFAQLGSGFGESATHDYMLMTTSGLSEYREKLLQMYADVIMNPAFSKAEIERKRSQFLAGIAQMPDQPSEYAGVLLDKELFGQHPYAHPTVGSKASIQKMKREQIQAFYSNHFRPNNSMLAVVGNIDDGFKSSVEKVFSEWKSAPIAKQPLPEPVTWTKREFKLYTKPGLQQTQIRIGQLGIARTDPDFLRLRLANIILGGAFASRLNQKVRDDLGLTYSISSQFDSKIGTGSFEINTFARNEKAGEAIQASLAVIEEFQQKGVTEKELKSAKALLVGQFPAAIETVDRLAMNLLALRVYGIPDTYLTDFFQNVNSITLKEVNEAINKRFHPERLKVVVFADEKEVQKSLADLGNFKIEKVE